MKHKLLGVLFILLVLTSCKDDESDSPSGNENPNPTSGTVSANINGNDFSGNQNLSRFLSYGTFIIKSEDDGSFLNFELEDFIGNATYSFTEGSGNSVEYYTTSNGELVGFRSLSGEIVITEFDEGTKTFNATFNIVFGKIGSPAITISGEGSYNSVKLVEMTEPEAGETTVFYSNNEYFELFDTARVFTNQVFLATFESDENGLTFEVQLDLESPNSVIINTGVDSYFIESNEILLWTYNEENQTATGHFKNFDSDEDLEIWFKDIPLDTVNESYNNITYDYNGDQITFEDGYINNDVQNDGTSRYSFVAFNLVSDTVISQLFVFDTFQSVSTGFTEPLSGEAIYQDPDNSSNDYTWENAVMTVESVTETSANLVVTIDGRGIITGEGIRINE